MLLFTDGKNRTESQHTALVDLELTLCGTVIFKCVGSAMQSSGWPDRYYSHKLWRGWVEWKSQDGIYRPMQVRKIRLLRNSGTEVVGCRIMPAEKCVGIELPNQTRHCRVDLSTALIRNPNIEATDLVKPAWGPTLLKSIARYCLEMRHEES